MPIVQGGELQPNHFDGRENRRFPVVNSLAYRKIAKITLGGCGFDPQRQVMKAPVPIPAAGCLGDLVRIGAIQEMIKAECRKIIASGARPETSPTKSRYKMQEFPKPADFLLAPDGREFCAFTVESKFAKLKVLEAWFGHFVGEHCKAGPLRAYRDWKTPPANGTRPHRNTIPHESHSA